MCDPAEDELGKAADEAIDLAEMKIKLAERMRFDADRGLAEEREKAMAALATGKPREDGTVVNREAKEAEHARTLRILSLRESGQAPSISRDVHYVAYGTPGGEFPSGVCRAAKITAVNDTPIDKALGVVSLFVMNPSGTFFNHNVPYDASKAPGSWHWPERV